jgi:hypothetical protein
MGPWHMNSITRGVLSALAAAPAAAASGRDDLATSLDIWSQHGFVPLTINSYLIAAFSVLITLPMGNLASYGLARTRGPRANVALAVLLTMLSLPPMLLVIPYYVLARALHLADTYAYWWWPFCPLAAACLLPRSDGNGGSRAGRPRETLTGAPPRDAARHPAGDGDGGSVQPVVRSPCPGADGPPTRTLPVALVGEGGGDASY